MLRTWIAGLVLTAGLPGAVYAQAPPQGATNTDELRSRQRIFMMEGVLERAVQLGVDNLRRRVRSVMPDDALLQGGVAQARGFPLDGYGVFFDIEVPTLRRSLAWEYGLGATLLAVVLAEFFRQIVFPPLMLGPIDALATAAPIGLVLVVTIAAMPTANGAVTSSSPCSSPIRR